MKSLSCEEISIIIDKFKEIKNKDTYNSVINSKLIYKENFDVGFEKCDLSIFEYNNYLYIRSIIGDVEWLEPLLIAVGEDNSICDFILLDFFGKFEKDLNLKKYFISQSDYSNIMEKVSSLENSKKQSLNILENLLETII